MNSVSVIGSLGRPLGLFFSLIGFKRIIFMNILQRVLRAILGFDYWFGLLRLWGCAGFRFFWGLGCTVMTC